VTRAILWYPLVSVLVAAGFALWAWLDCGSVNAPARCRSEVLAQTLWVFAIVLAIGLVLLALLWLVTAPLAARRGRGVAEGFRLSRGDPA
jgi:hypothetical protein